MRTWGWRPQERSTRLPVDEIIEDVIERYTRAITIDAPPDVVWPWLVEIGDRRASVCRYDWIERLVFLGTVRYVEHTRSATRIHHPELQEVHVGDRINAGSVRRLEIGSPITSVDEARGLVIDTWAFSLEPLVGDRTRLLVRERDSDTVCRAQCRADLDLAGAAEKREERHVPDGHVGGPVAPVGGVR